MTESMVNLVASNDLKGLTSFYRNDFASTNYSINSAANKENIPLKSINLIHIAALHDSLESFIFLERNRGINILLLTADHYNALHYACAGNSIEVAEYILAKHPELPSIDTQTNHQYIYLAVSGNAPDILELLFKYGAKIDSSANKKDKATDYAIRSRKIRCLEILLRHMPARNYDTSNYSPLMLAIINSQPNAIPLLLDSGADPSIITSDGNTVLSLNCFFLGDVEITKRICDMLIDVDLPKGRRGEAAVHWLCKSKKPEIAKIILDKDIDVNRYDKEGFLGPHYLIDTATEEDALKILDLLYEHGLNIDLRYDNSHNCLLGEFMQSIIAVPNIIDWFLTKNANIDVPFVLTGHKAKTMTIRQKLREMGGFQMASNQKLRQILQKHHII